MSHESPSFREHNEVRVPTLEKLVALGWRRAQIVCPSPDGTDKEWRVPKNPSAQAARRRGRSFPGYPVDIALFDSVEGVSDPQHALIIVECKLPGDPSGLTELETYLTLEPHALMGILTDGRTVTRTYKRPDGSFKRVRSSSLPRPDEDFILSDASIKGLDLHVPTEEELRAVFDRMLNVVVSSDGTSTRPDDRLDQICNLLLLKLESDGEASLNPHAHVVFQTQKSRTETAARVNGAYVRYCRRNPTLFDEGCPTSILLDDATLHAAVFELQELNLHEIKPTALSYAFQVFRSANLKIGEGQYFTPYRVIEAGTKMIQVTSRDRVIDPACGTGSFLSEAFLAVREVVGDAEASRWAHRNLFGVDLDNINVKLARALMVGIGDGSTNAYVGDSLRERKWANDAHGLRDTMRSGGYTVVLTNPPFGKGLQLSAADARESQYSVCDRSNLGDARKSYADTELGIVFVERAWRLLEEGGRLGIVLPETYFFSRKYEWFRKWVDDHFHLRGVLNIPMEAFQGFCRAKTNFYVFQKRPARLPEESAIWFDTSSIWVSNAGTIGINKDGKELYVIDKVTKKPTQELDNVALADVRSLVEGRGDTPTSHYVPARGVYGSLVGVPRYSDDRSARECDQWIRRRLPECQPFSLGDLVNAGYLKVCGGHGSPSADVRGGNIPYIKVSDLRNGSMNPNPSNMVSKTVARRYWRADSSGLKPYDIVTPARASKNIGEPVMVLPGQEEVVLTKEVLVFSVSEEAPFDSFFLMWALCSPQVLRQWERVVFMQTNREDVGDRWREVLVPLPSTRGVADELCAPYRTYYKGLARLRKDLDQSLVEQGLV